MLKHKDLNLCCVWFRWFSGVFFLVAGKLELSKAIGLLTNYINYTSLKPPSKQRKAKDSMQLMRARAFSSGRWVRDGAPCTAGNWTEQPEL